MDIRLAKREDFKNILPLFIELDLKHIKNTNDIREKIPKERYKRIFEAVFQEKSNHILTVVENDGSVIAFALGKIRIIQNNLVFKNNIIGEILYVIVKKEHKMKGIGKKLMIDLENRLRSNGAKKLELKVYNFNKETLPEKVGFKEKYTVYEK